MSNLKLEYLSICSISFLQYVSVQYKKNDFSWTDRTTCFEDFKLKVKILDEK